MKTPGARAAPLRPAAPGAVVRRWSLLLLAGGLFVAGCGGPPASAPGDAAAGAAPFVRHAVEGFEGLAVSAVQQAVAERNGAPLAFRDPDGRVFVLVPGGTSLQGSPDEEAGRGSDEVLHEVRLGLPYYVDVTPRVAEGAFDPAAIHAEAARLSAADPLWSYRWIREAEWEHAARAGTRGPWPTFDGRPPDDVASFVNAWGLRGIGAAPEVVADHHGPLPSWAVADPTGPREGDTHVVRGAAVGAGPPRVAVRRPLRVGATLASLRYRLVAPLGYGLGHYGRHTVRFRWLTPDLEPAPTAVLGDAHLRLIRMENRLGEREGGRTPVWARLEGAGTEVVTRLVPGRYYVFVERGEAGTPVHRRGLEVKFTVHDDTTVDVPLPPDDGKRYGESSPQ